MNAIFPSAPSSYTWKSRFAFSRSHFVFFPLLLFYFSPLRFAFIALPLLPSMLLLYFFKLSYTSSFLISIQFYFFIESDSYTQTQQRVLYSSSFFFFFFFSLSLLIHRRRRMCNLELLHFSRVIWAPLLRLLRVVVLRKKEAISNFFLLHDEFFSKNFVIFRSKSNCWEWVISS